ncbi:hypothetical protein [Flagellimonas sp. C4]|uniref:hypothetical protein n=1 Tax=Flagellimonas alginolytica TaxID=3177515 RepID=UPI0035C8B828
MEEADKSILKKLTQLKELLISEGYNTLSMEINGFIYGIENEDLETFEKHYKSLNIWGGAGSLRDIDFRDYNKNRLRDDTLKSLKQYKRKNDKPFWKFW